MYLSMKKVCARYDVTRDTIYKWMRDGKFPQPVKVNGATRWREEDLKRWEPVK